jgi:hypothetical protein
MVGNITAMRALALLGLIVMLRWFILAAIVIGFVAFNIWLAKERRLTCDEQRRRAEAALIAQPTNNKHGASQATTAAPTASTRPPRCSSPC